MYLAVWRSVRMSPYFRTFGAVQCCSVHWPSDWRSVRPGFFLGENSWATDYIIGTRDERPYTRNCPRWKYATNMRGHLSLLAYKTVRILRGKGGRRTDPRLKQNSTSARAMRWHLPECASIASRDAWTSSSHGSGADTHRASSSQRTTDDDSPRRRTRV